MPQHHDDPETFAHRVRRDAITVFEEVRRLGPLVRCDIPIMGRTHVLHRREDLRTLFETEADAFVLGPLMSPLAPFFGRRSVICLDGPEHLARRRLVLPAFHGAALPAMEAEIRELAAEVLPGWPGEHPRELLPLTQALTFAAILRVAFGIRDPLRARAAGEALRAHFVAAGRGEVDGPEPVGPLVQALLDERRTAGHDGHDLLGLLLAARDERGDPLDDAILRDELLTTLTAGHETTASGLAWAATLLAHHPRVVESLREERAAGGRALLDATVNEVLRLRPPLMGTSRIATREVRLGGHDLPAGSHVTASTLLVHLDPDRYDDPHEFRPERFLGVRPAKADWMPFGGGVHRCAGAAFAHLELRVVLEEMLDTLEFEPVGPPPRVALVVNTHVPRDGALLRVRSAASLSQPALTRRRGRSRG